MVRRALTLLCLALLAVFMTSCGQTYKLQSINVTPGALGATGASAVNLEGIGKFQALTVTALYSNTKTEDITTRATYQLGASGDPNAPIAAVSLNNSGVVKAVDAACTWYAEPTDSPTNSLFGYSTNPYIVTITYQGHTTTAYISVASAAGCYDGQAYPAPKGFGGN